METRFRMTLEEYNKLPKVQGIGGQWIEYLGQHWSSGAFLVEMPQVSVVNGWLDFSSWGLDLKVEITPYPLGEG